MLIYWELPLLEQYAGEIFRSDFFNPCSDTQSNVWKYFDHYMQAYEVLDTNILTKQLFWNCPKNDHELIVKKYYVVLKLDFFKCLFCEYHISLSIGYSGAILISS